MYRCTHWARLELHQRLMQISCTWRHAGYKGNWNIDQTDHEQMAQPGEHSLQNKRHTTTGQRLWCSSLHQQPEMRSGITNIAQSRRKRYRQRSNTWQEGGVLYGNLCSCKGTPSWDQP
jgi:hypothetical protein